MVVIDFDAASAKLTFTKEEGGALVDPYREKYGEMFEPTGDELAAAAEVGEGGGLITAPLKAIEKQE
jgi:hypothetical protein